MSHHLSLLMPEWILLGTFFILLLVELARGRNSVYPEAFYRFSGVLFTAGPLLVLLALVTLFGTTESAFKGSFILDNLASFFKFLLMLTALVILPLSQTFIRGVSRPGEYLLILWTAFIGMFFLVSANDFLVMFISLEIVTLASYILTCFDSKEKGCGSIEAGIKYLILGSIASAFMIYGISLLYTASGSLSFPEIRQAMLVKSKDSLMLLGVLLVIFGVGFKIAAFPFQFWVPDVYQGAPTPVTAFLATSSKAAGFALLIRLLFTVWAPLAPAFAVLFSVLAALTIVYGNFGALKQTNIKRLFGYSGIGHAGYLLIGFAVQGSGGAEAVFYYLIAYILSNLAAFTVITLAGQALESDEINAYSGLAKRSPLLAASLFIALISLAGVPGTAGFIGKFLILLGAVQNGFEGLALIGILAVIVSLYYYLSVVRVMFAQEPSAETVIEIPKFYQALLPLLCVLIFAAGFFPAPLLALGRIAASALF